jgi:mono/diheme cytochrome c family protein
MSAARRVWIPLAAGVVTALAAFVVVLLATSGGDGKQSDSAARAPAQVSAGKGDPRGGRLVFAEMGCGSCHALKAAGSRGGIGPSLDDALPDHTRASLAAKIQSPGTGTVMPQDFAQRMSFAELDALLDFLMAARAGDRGSS